MKKYLMSLASTVVILLFSGLAFSGQWYNLGDIPGLEPLQGPADCHGRSVPPGEWWGKNLKFNPKAEAPQNLEIHSWSELKEADGKPLADYRPGDPVLFLYAYKNKATGVVSKTVPDFMDCVSTYKK